MTRQYQYSKEISFKHVRSGETKTYMIDPYWSIHQLLIIIKPKIISDFNVEHFDIVEAGQNRLENYDVIEDNDELVCNRFGEDVNVSFYIRPILDECINECIICYDMLSNPTCYFNCIHIVCTACVNELSVHICPLCRQ